MSPEAFEKCVASGGRVRTKTLKGGKYIHICFKNGKSYAGHTKKKNPVKKVRNWHKKNKR